MRWLQTSCPMDSSLNKMETGGLLAGRRGGGIGVTGAAKPPLYPTGLIATRIQSWHCYLGCLAQRGTPQTRPAGESFR